MTVQIYNKNRNLCKIIRNLSTLSAKKFFNWQKVCQKSVKPRKIIDKLAKQLLTTEKLKQNKLIYFLLLLSDKRI